MGIEGQFFKVCSLSKGYLGVSQNTDQQFLKVYVAKERNYLYTFSFKCKNWFEEGGKGEVLLMFHRYEVDIVHCEKSDICI